MRAGASRASCVFPRRPSSRSRVVDEVACGEVVRWRAVRARAREAGGPRRHRSCAAPRGRHDGVVRARCPGDVGRPRGSSPDGLALRPRRTGRGRRARGHADGRHPRSRAGACPGRERREALRARHRPRNDLARRRARVARRRVGGGLCLLAESAGGVRPRRHLANQAHARGPGRRRAPGQGRSRRARDADGRPGRRGRMPSERHRHCRSRPATPR